MRLKSKPLPAAVTLPGGLSGLAPCIVPPKRGLSCETISLKYEHLNRWIVEGSDTTGKTGETT